MPTSEGDKSSRADLTADDYADRATRNEGRLIALESLFNETRKSDRALVEQRSDALLELVSARADGVLELLTTRADAVLDLGQEERKGDRQHVETLTAEAEKRIELALGSLREVQDTAISENYKQSREAITALEQRATAGREKIEQMVRQWRDSDGEARDLFTKQLDRHLDALNHNNERMREFQATSVTRELWQSEKDAAIKREGLLRDQIIAIDKTLLTMNPIEQADKTHSEMTKTMESSIAAASRVLDNKIGVLDDKLAELKTYRDTTQGRSSGYQAFYGWGIAALTVVISVVVLANLLLTK